MSSSFAAHGVALYAISYDSVDTLRLFAERHGVTYPMLADEGSTVIRRLGVYDYALDEHHAAFGRETRPAQRHVAYPSVFVLDAEGVVVQKRHQPDYRTRESGSMLLEEGLGVAVPAGELATVSRSGVVRVSAWLDVPCAARYERFRAVVELDVDPGWHVYGSPALGGCTALDLTVEPQEGLDVGVVELPTAATLADGVRAYEGRVRLALPLSYRVEAGVADSVLALRMRYQACGELECLAPAQTGIELAVPICEVEAG